jgi:hypothetical protein
VDEAFRYNVPFRRRLRETACAPSWCKPLEEANSSSGFEQIADLFHNVFHSFCEDRVTIRR